LILRILRAQPLRHFLDRALIFVHVVRARVDVHALETLIRLGNLRAKGVLRVHVSLVVALVGAAHAEPLIPRSLLLLLRNLVNPVG